jgi:hypothetical protein
MQLHTVYLGTGTCYHNSLSWDPILCLFNSMHISTTYFSKIYFMDTLHRVNTYVRGCAHQSLHIVVPKLFSRLDKIWYWYHVPKIVKRI